MVLPRRKQFETQILEKSIKDLKLNSVQFEYVSHVIKLKKKHAKFSESYGIARLRFQYSGQN